MSVHLCTHRCSLMHTHGFEKHKIMSEGVPRERLLNHDRLNEQF